MADADSSKKKTGPKPDTPRQPKRERLDKSIDEGIKKPGYDHDINNPFLQRPEKPPPKKT